MTIRLLKCNLYAVLFLLPVIASAQNIVIDDSLAAHVDMYKVKMGGQGLGKVWKISFGDYAVTSSKAGWVKISGKSNWLNTKKASKTTQKFSFVLSHTSGKMAEVNAATYKAEKWVEPIEVYPEFYVGEYKTLFDSSNFNASIMLNQDTAQTWALFLIMRSGSKTNYKNEAILTNGVRKISIETVTSDRYGNDSRSLPATGYEFVEGSQAIGAVQYFGGGIFGTNKCIAWIHESLEPDMKLLVAAAITAVLQARYMNMGMED